MMTIAITLYLCGVFCLACLAFGFYCLGGDDRIGIEEVMMFVIVVTWPISVPAIIIRFIIRAIRWKARNSNY